MAKGKEAKEAKEAPEETKGGEGAAGEGGEGGVKKAAKKKIIIIAAVAVVVLVGGGAGLYFSGILGGKKEEAVEGTEKGGESKEAAVDPKKKKLYMNIGEFLVNLNVSGKQTSFLKMSATLEVQGEGNKKAVEENLPRIKDTFQVYLRELRAEDLKGSAGVFRLREALLLRVNKAIAPGQVSDILFEELIVQ